MSIFDKTPRQRVPRSVFDLSYSKKFTCDMGELIPSYIQEMVPGDVMNIDAELVMRFQPLVAPVMHEINATIHYFFVPYRILWDDWESFMTGGADGTEAPTIPRWATGFTNNEGTLWDYLEYPTGVQIASGAQPVTFPLNAYHLIWNTYYRDQTQQAEVALDVSTLHIRNWEKDYLTSALPWQQRGDPVSLPLAGVLDVDGKAQDITFTNQTTGTHALRFDNTPVNADAIASGAFTGSGNARWADPSLEVDLAAATTFDVADIRLAFQTQKFLERNAVGGARYTEFLQQHYNVSPRDDRLDRPEFVGGMKTPVIISEVLQTSEDGTTPQGNMAGHGISVGRKHITKYRATEFGIMMGILSVMPTTAYSQGIDRQWLRSTRYDYFLPEFVNLSEQAITHAELYMNATPADNITIFGYQGRYNEMRARQDKICGDMRATFDYWHLGRQFGSKPSLNSSFMEYDGRKDIFAAPSIDGLIITVGNKVRAARPLPIIPNPGYIDH